MYNCKIIKPLTNRFSNIYHNNEELFNMIISTVILVSIGGLIILGGLWLDHRCTYYLIFKLDDNNEIVAEYRRYDKLMHVYKMDDIIEGNVIKNLSYIIIFNENFLVSTDSNNKLTLNGDILYYYIPACDITETVMNKVLSKAIDINFIESCIRKTISKEDYENMTNMDKIKYIMIKLKKD